MLGGILGVGIAIGIGWSAKLRWANQQVPAIEQLVTDRRYFEAYTLAAQVRNLVSNEGLEQLKQWQPLLDDQLTVTSEPSGARIWIEPFIAKPGTTVGPIDVGPTPIRAFKIARGDYIIRAEKDGYAPFQRSWSGNVIEGPPAPIIQESAAVHLTLSPVAETPPGMVFVPGGPYQLVASNAPTTEQVQLNGFFIDRNEVTNREYREFVTGGGYRDPSFWTQPLIKDGRTLSWDEAMDEFRDRSGLAGPRDWVEQSYPMGQDDHPVTGICWYEALAYANFRGKCLPTIFQWEKAARDGTANVATVMPWGVSGGTATTLRANLLGRSTMPVGQFKFGMSPFGCYDMAGNVAEWCLTGTPQGYISAGASWESFDHQFASYGPFPPCYQSNTLGFRCVKNSSPAANDPQTARIETTYQIPKYQPAPIEKVQTWLAQYEPDRSVPLQVQIDQRIETDDWARERIRFMGSARDSVPAYLYVPKNFPPPYQVIHLVPAGDVSSRHRTVPQSIENDYAASLIRSGRAIFVVVLQGYRERDWPENWNHPDPASQAHLAKMVAHVRDLRRGLDYLETRPDLDARKIAFLMLSAGGTLAGLPAIDPRYQAVILSSSGLKPDLEETVNREASLVHLAPLMRTPKLLLQGLYDEGFRYHTNYRPLYDLLPEPKIEVAYHGGHRPSAKDFLPPVMAFLDEQLGKVNSRPVK